MEKIVQKPDLKNIKNIIFDFGNVLLNINPALTAEAFKKLGIKDESDFFGGRSSIELMVKYERGQATSEEFIQAISASVSDKVTSEQIIDAWNALLLDFPSIRVELLQQLRSDYRLFLLSNTNQIHFEKYTQQFQAIYGYPLESLFEKMWFSHQIGLSKPDTAVFEFVLKDKNLNPAETLFIDDTLMHVEAARKSGIYGWHLTQGSDVCEILK
ncbi:MAG: HAD family phosphatase [Lentimicrobium sp.]|nr:HAD family phosphatase [Lentimicrobium sp.]